MRSVILKGTEITRINYLTLSRQTSHKILKLVCDYGEGENGQIMAGKGSRAVWPAGAGMPTQGWPVVCRSWFSRERKQDAGAVLGTAPPAAKSGLG